ncbi:MAG: hypothetical protein KC495_13265 [Dehalococcoidia bacterium]|nr:hypothetical protein [Dehalococcoidia bacterium]MCB9485453.1 hypothetical protein [Thermoflexaceae bacterium]
MPDDYRPHARIPRNVVHFLDRGSAIALDAALQAVEMAGLESNSDARRIAIADGLPYRAPGQATMFAPNGHLIARVAGARGAAVITGGAEASGMAALAAGIRLITSGDADAVVAGAAQTLQRPLLDHLLGAGLATRGEAKPFDRAHDGLLPAEGAAYVTIEAEGTARERGATVLARLTAYAEHFDSSVEPLAVSEAAEAGRVQQDALTRAGYLQGQVDLLVSCADGRPAVDFAEGFGTMRTFGRHAFFAGVTSAAGALGNTLAASGPVAVVSALMALERQSSFPVAGLSDPEEGVELAYVRQTRAERLNCVMVTSTGLGGTLISLLIER